jgi:acetylornithine deacetylase
MGDQVADAAVGLLHALVGINSVNPSLVAGAPGEADIVEFLRQRLDRAGFTTTIIRARGQSNRPSLIAIGPERSDSATIILNGHLDTVGVSGMDAPFTPRVDGNRLYARGAADMKGGVAAMVVAAEHLVASGAPVRPVLALVADEEDASLGSEAVIAALPDLGVAPDACLIAEPTDLDLCRSLRGFGVVNVSIPGRAAHSSQADLGINALTHLGRLLHAIDTQAPRLRESGGDLMATVARGGTSAFVIPDFAECVVEVRTSPDGFGADALDVVRSLLMPEWSATTELVSARDGWRLDTSGVAADLAARLGRALGTGPTFDAPYWMEAPLWQALCPTLICGPGGGGLHAVDEWVDLDQVRAFTMALVAVLSDWTRPPRE